MCKVTIIEISTTPSDSDSGRSFNTADFNLCSLQLTIMGGPLECVRRADRRADVGGVSGRSHGHACAPAQSAGE